MKNYSKLIFIFIFVQFTLSLSSQNFVKESTSYEEIFNLALTLEEQGLTTEACTEYKRFLFMQDYLPQDENQDFLKSQSFSHLSNLYNQLGNEELAIQYLQNAINLASPDEKNELIIRHIKLLTKQANSKNAFLTSNYFFAAYLYLDNFDISIKKTASLSLLENLTALEQWEELSSCFDLYTKQYDDLFTKEEQDRFHSQIETILGYKPKDPKLAGYLSVIPGLGQLYAHNYKDALNAFLLNSTLIGVSTWSLISLDFWTFSLLEFGPTFRFYRGNMTNAQKHTYTYNKNQIQSLAQPLMEIITNGYKKI